MKTAFAQILKISLAVLVIAANSVYGQNDIEDVTVEIYYVSDANDATDTNGGPSLPEGSVTYRVFLTLAPQAQLRAIYGSANHPLVISSTEPFYNNEQRGRTFGYQIQNNFLNRNTVALDSWLSFGAASNALYGVLKDDDTNGSIVGGVNNDGGSESIPGGLLVNNDPLAGLPLTQSDGLMAGESPTTPPALTVIPAGAFDAIFRDITSSETTFNSINARMQTSGVSGFNSENRMLIAQLTTLGELSFELNLEIINAQGNVVKYVALEAVSGANEIQSSFLKYPPECGCTDPDYLEFSAGAGCDDGSCVTLIQFGCLDPEACNYNPDANFNVPGLCCFGPSNCNGLDINIVCPFLSVDDDNAVQEFVIYPNPTRDFISIRPGKISTQELEILIVDIAGNTVFKSKAFSNDQIALSNINTRNLAQGLYAVHIIGYNFRVIKKLVKI